MKKKSKREKMSTTFSLRPELISRVAQASMASGLSVSLIAEQGLELRLKSIPLICEECGGKMVGGICSTPARHQ